MLSKADKETDKVLGLLLMRYNVNPYEGIFLVKDWLVNHPEEDWRSLEEFILMEGVILENGVLKDVYPLELYSIISSLRLNNILTIEDRWYKLQKYYKCFVGSEAVEWISFTQRVTKEAAIALGRMLVKYRIIHHVVDEHDFEDSYLFYRFYLDEKK